MDINSKFKQNLSKMIFVEVKNRAIEDIFKIKLSFKEDIYLPLNSGYLISNISDDDKINNIPITIIINGMFYTLGADEHFKYNDFYKEILSKSSNSVAYIKTEISEQVKKEQYERAYILIKGLLHINSSKENYEKAIYIVEEIRSHNSDYIEEEMELIESWKQLYDYPMPYFYSALVYKDKGIYDLALISINDYFSKGGENSKEALEFRNMLENVTNYEKGKELIYDDPKKALQLLLPIMNIYEEDALIYYYVAIAYRVLENYEKAIYYLNQSFSIDNNIVEVVNELGLDYACINDYRNALNYFEKAFEVMQSIEICTNIVMCYINLGDKDSAKKYLMKAKQIDPKDEIVKQLEKMLN